MSDGDNNEQNNNNNGGNQQVNPARLVSGILAERKKAQLQAAKQAAKGHIDKIFQLHASTKDEVEKLTEVFVAHGIDPAPQIVELRAALQG